MSKRFIIVDDTPIDQINMGNPEMARVWRKLLHEINLGQVEMWTTPQVHGWMTEADRMLMLESTVQVPSVIDFREWEAALRDSSLRLDNPALGSLGSLSRAKELYALTIFLRNRMGKAVTIQLLTGATELPRAWGATGEGIAPEMSGVQLVNFDPLRRDFNHARRLVGFVPLNIDVRGNIIKTVKAPPIPPPPPGTVNEPARSVLRNQRGRLQAKPSFFGREPDAGNRRLDPETAEAGFQAFATFILEGINYTIQNLNDREQKARFEADWKKHQPGIERTLRENPSLGVLILVTYSQRQKVGAEHDSPLEHVMIWEYTTWEFGYSEHDAKTKYDRRPKIAPAGGPSIGYVGHTQWIEPAEPVDIAHAPTPFPKAALGTFIPGKETLVDAEWAPVGGFGNTGTTRVDVRGGLQAAFYVLDPYFEPQHKNSLEVSYFHFGQWKYKEVDCVQGWAGEVENSGPEAAVLKVPFLAVDLGRRDAPLSRAAAFMVYPADRYTEHLFAKTPATKDNLNFLQRYDLSLIRWVEPQNVRLLEYLRDG
jgi:hypothetical protein